jgi:hypothetical protein
VFVGDLLVTLVSGLRRPRGRWSGRIVAAWDSRPAMSGSDLEIRSTSAFAVSIQLREFTLLSLIGSLTFIFV